MITKAELEGMDELNVYEAIRRLRPTWLRYRGQATLTGPNRESLRIYMNRHYFGDAESLSDVLVRDVRELRFLDARQATLRFGTDHTVGAIIITTGGGMRRLPLLLAPARDHLAVVFTTITPFPPADP
jgi:hypothetical protein